MLHYCTDFRDLKTQFTSTFTTICIYSSIFQLLTSTSNGGAIYLLQSNMTCSIRNCVFLSCKSESTHGGAIFSQIFEFSARFCEGQKCESTNRGLFIFSIANRYGKNHFGCSSVYKCAESIVSPQICTVSLSTGDLVAEANNISYNNAYQVSGIIGYQSPSKLFKYINMINNSANSKIVQMNEGTSNTMIYSNVCFNSASDSVILAIHPVSSDYTWVISDCIMYGNTPKAISIINHNQTLIGLLIIKNSYIESYVSHTCLIVQSPITPTTLYDMKNFIQALCTADYTMAITSKLIPIAFLFTFFIQ